MGNVRDWDPWLKAGIGAGAPPVVKSTVWGMAAVTQFTVPPALRCTLTGSNTSEGALTVATAPAAMMEMSATTVLV